MEKKTVYLYENEKIKMGTDENEKNLMSLYENEKIKMGTDKIEKNIIYLRTGKNLKKTREKTNCCSHNEQHMLFIINLNTGLHNVSGIHSVCIKKSYIQNQVIRGNIFRIDIQDCQLETCILLL